MEATLPVRFYWIKGETIAKALKISTSAYCNIEKGKVDLKLSLLFSISLILETDILYILCNIQKATNNALEENREDISRLNRIVGILVCRNEYLTDQVNCIQQKEEKYLKAI